MKNSKNKDNPIKWGISHFMKDVEEQGLKKIYKYATLKIKKNGTEIFKDSG